MNPFTRLIGVLLFVAPKGVGASEHDWPAPTRVDPERVSVSMSSRAGLVTRPFITTNFPEVSGSALLVISVAAVRVSPANWLHLKVPFSSVRLDLPAGAQVAETALGNAEIGLEHALELHPTSRLGLLAAWLAPSAEHGPRAALHENRALALASALNGDADSSLLTPGVTGLRLNASIEHSQGPFQLRASLDLPMLVRIGAASLPGDVETRPLAIMPAADARGAWWLTSGFGVSLGLGVLTEPLRIQEPTRARDRQLRVHGIVEPGVHVRLGHHVTLALDASVPIGGSLGGDAWSIGVHGRVGL